MAQPRESTVSHMLDQYIELTPGAAGPIVHKTPPAASVAGIGATLRCGSSFFPGMKTNVYIDGLNLYYGAVRGTPYKWLDVGKLCSRVLPPYASLNRIRYFTAVVKSRPDDPHAPVRQATHFRALGTIPNLTIHEGQFRSNERLVRLVHPIEGLGRTTIKRALVQKDEEKGSDVNLASWLLIDGFRRDFQSALVISNDSDLVEPIRFVRQELRRACHVVHPHRQDLQELREAATTYSRLDANILSECQLAQTLTDSAGRTITKPKDW